MAEGDRLGHELAEDDREERKQHRDRDEGDRRGALGERAELHEELGQAAGDVHGSVGGGEEAEDGEAELRHREEAARIVLEPADDARAPVSLVDELVDAAAAQRDEGDLGRDEEPLEDRQEDDHPELEDELHQAGCTPGVGPGFAKPGGHADREHAGRDVVRHDRAGAGPRTVADRDRGDEHRVRADERVGADRRAVLPSAVEVGRDRPGADVRPLADVRVPDVAEVVLLDPGPDAAVLHLRVVAELRTAPDRRARPKVRERPDADVVLDLGPLEDARDDLAATPDDAVHDPAARPDPRPLPDRRPSAEHDVRLEDDVGRELDGGVDVDRRGILHGHAGLHVRDADPLGEQRLRVGEVDAVVDPGESPVLVDLEGRDRTLVLARELDELREVELARGRGRVQVADPPRSQAASNA